MFFVIFRRDATKQEAGPAMPNATQNAKHGHLMEWICCSKTFVFERLCSCFRRDYSVRLCDSVYSIQNRSNLFGRAQRTTRG
jgi:hypothetical protein